MARREVSGLAVILCDVVLPARSGGKLAALGIGGRGGAGNLVECLRCDARLAGAGSGLGDHARDHVALVRRLAGHRLRLARHGERLLRLFAFQEVDGALQRLADLGANGLRLRRLVLRARWRRGKRRKHCQRAEKAQHGILQRMNCSLPISPILVKPSRCAEAISIAKLSYFTCFSGRRSPSGCTAIAAAPRRWASRSARSRRTSPFQTMVPSKSTSMVTTCG